MSTEQPIETVQLLIEKALTIVKTMPALADTLQIHRQNLWAIRKGYRRMSVDDVINLASIGGWPESYALMVWNEHRKTPLLQYYPQRQRRRKKQEKQY